MKIKARPINKTAFFFFLLCSLLFFCPLSQSLESITLKGVEIQGNLRVEKDGIRLHLKSRAGDAYDPAVVRRDVKSIYRMGFFDDVKAELSSNGILTYSVTEKPYIREINIVGNKEVSREKIDAALGIGVRTILDRDKVSKGVENVKKLYREQGHLNAKVDFAISPLENNQAIIQLEIDEGKRLLIKKISFEGNKTFSDSDLKGVMATKEEWFLSFLDNRGVLENDILTNDRALLSNHYYDHGYIDLKIGEPLILRRRDGIEVVIRLEEGDQYRVGKVEIGGDLIQEAETLLNKIEITSGQIFRGKRLRNDIGTLSEIYSDKGFAFVQVEPANKVNPEEKTIDIALVITRGPPVYFNRITVSGNTKTRDKVVRRELRATEQELFSGDKIEKSRNALRRTGYFEDVQLDVKKAKQPGTVDLLVGVKEGPTGTFSVGGGISAGDFFATSSVSEKNLFGRGQKVNVQFNLGTSAQDFNLSFTEPYLYDTPLSLGVNAFNREQDFSDFTSRKTGFSTTTSYPLKYIGLPFFQRPPSDDPGFERTEENYHPILEHARGGMGYQIAHEKINNIDDDASDEVQAEEGKSLTSSISPTLTYDSTDHHFSPTEGTKSRLGVEFAGLGGDVNFIKTDVSARWYYSFLRDPDWGTYTLALGGTLGYGVSLSDRPNGEDNLPLFKRYFPGGMKSVRGFDDRSLGPRGTESCTNTDEVAGVNCTIGETDESIGGDKQAIMNLELHFPIYDEFGLRGLAFFDSGQAFASSESFDLGEFRNSVGVGGSWLSPFGPLEVSLGFPLNAESGDETSVLGFSLGGQ